MVLPDTVKYSLMVLGIIVTTKVIESLFFKYPHNKFLNSGADKMAYHEALQSESLKHFQTVERIQNLRLHSDKFFQIFLIARNVFSELEASYHVLKDNNIVPRVSNISSEVQVRKAVNATVSNTILYAQLIIAEPDIAADFLAIYKEWITLYVWAFKYTLNIDPPEEIVELFVYAYQGLKTHIVTKTFKGKFKGRGREFMEDVRRKRDLKTMRHQVINKTEL